MLKICFSKNLYFFELHQSAAAAAAAAMVFIGEKYKFIVRGKLTGGKKCTGSVENPDLECTDKKSVKSMRIENPPKI